VTRIWTSSARLTTTSLKPTATGNCRSAAWSTRRTCSLRQSGARTTRPRRTSRSSKTSCGAAGRCRARLDAGLGSRLFVKLRGLEEEDGKHGQYRVLILGALFMRAGARIRRCDRQHLRELVDQIPSRAGFSLPPNDGGFRDPGRAQYLAALENYKAGTPRSFVDPRYGFPSVV